MAAFLPVDPFDIVIFGATGDLASRKLMPALYRRFADGQISHDSQIIGVARSQLSREAFVETAQQNCKEHVVDWDKELWHKFSKLIWYFALDPTKDDADWQSLKTQIGEKDRPLIFYLATTPLIYVATCAALGKEGLNRPNARLVLEKPIGKDLQSALEINEGVGAIFEETKIYRIDHYLGKETVQNLTVLRFDNILFDSVWGRNQIDHVQITVSEHIGLEGRADYYDRSGAVRDMVQNHILQLLCLVAMEPPNTLNADDIRMEKVKVLRALKDISQDNIDDDAVFGQYQAAEIDGQMVESYEETLQPENRPSQTETFVALRAEVKNGRWAGVPFYLRTGKRMTDRRSEIVIQFKETPHSLFENARNAPNRLILRLQPDEGVRMFIQIKDPGPGGLRIRSLPLNLSYADNFTVQYPDAYDRLLLDVVRGNLSLFIRREEVEAAWKWIDTLRNAWKESGQHMMPYDAGTNGPQAAHNLLSRDGREWWN